MSQNPVFRRLSRTFAGYGISQIVTLLTQVLTLPLLAKMWGKEVYAEWLLIASIPAYMALGDLGFGQALGNEIGRLWASDKKEEAATIYSAAWTTVIFACTTFASLLVVGYFIVPVHKLLHLSKVEQHEMIVLLLLFTFQVFLAQLVGVLRAVFRAEGFASLSVTVANVISFMTLSMLALNYVVRGTPYTLAWLNTGVSVLGVVLNWVIGRKKVSWLIPQFRPHLIPASKPLLKPGLGMNLINLGSVLSVQGTLIVVAAATTPQIALIFSATRTLTRAVNQLTNTVQSTFTPELSSSIGASDWQLSRLLHRRASQISLWSAIVSSLALLTVAKPLFLWWTHLPFNLPLLLLLLSALVVNGIYWGSISVPLAVNRHFRISVYYSGACLFSLLLCWILGQLMGLVGCGIAVVVVEIIMVFVVVPESLSIVQDTLAPWCETTFSPNFGWILRRGKP